jgi:hypothetical protein
VDIVKIRRYTDIEIQGLGGGKLEKPMDAQLRFWQQKLKLVDLIGTTLKRSGYVMLCQKKL